MVTGRGSEEYFSPPRSALRAHETKADVLAAGLGFAVGPPRQEALTLLRQRLAGLEAWRAEVVNPYGPEQGPEQQGHSGEVMDLWVRASGSEDPRADRPDRGRRVHLRGRGGRRTL